MKRVRGHASAMFVLTAGLFASACGQSDEPELEALGSSGEPELEATAAEETTGEAALEEVSGEVSRYVGVFHSESRLVPLGVEVDDPGRARIINLEIRPGGTATMTMETCNEAAETEEISLRWRLGRGPWIEFEPGPGEASLRFMSSSDLRSLLAIPVEGCSLQFEANGIPVTDETFHPGRACWVNRCEGGTVQIDHCEGEERPACDAE